MRTFFLCLLLLVAPTAVVIGWQYPDLLREGFDHFKSWDGETDKESTGPGEVLFFSANWCGACRRMKPIVSRMQDEGYKLRSVNVDRHPKLAQKFRVASIPTFVFLQNGREVNRYTGTTSSEHLHGLCASAAYSP